MAINGDTLARVVDKVTPGGSLVAGESSFDWRAAKAAKRTGKAT